MPGNCPGCFRGVWGFKEEHRLGGAVFAGCNYLSGKVGLNLITLRDCSCSRSLV